MVVICSNCKTRLQLDEGKIPPHAFKVRCPKCQAGIEVKSSANNESDDQGPISLAAEVTPSSTNMGPFERPPVAARYKGTADEAPATAEPDAAISGDVVKFLSELVHGKDADFVKHGPSKRPTWDRRKALVCMDSSQRDSVANGLADHNYEVFVAENAAEALGRMREDRIDVLILDADFDPAEQGFAFVMRELKLLRPAERRRVFLVCLTPNARTMDLHAAFLHNANLVVNPSDVERLPEALDVSLRHYNELYREVNRVLELTPI